MLNTDIVQSGMYVWSKDALEFPDHDHHGVVIEVRTSVDEDGVISRAFLVAHEWRRSVRFRTITEADVGDILPMNQRTVRGLLRAIAAEKSTRKGLLTSEDVQATMAELVLLKVAGLMPV